MLCFAATAGAATAPGSLAVTATVDGSISLVFNTDGSGVTLGAPGTSAASLAFGNVSAFGLAPSNVSVSVVPGTSFTVSTPVDVYVDGANVTTASGFSLTAQLLVADAVNTWKVRAVPVTNASPATIYSTSGNKGPYATNNSTIVAVTIPFTTAATTVVSNTINFVATAN
jgi:hypothetical protein